MAEEKELIVRKTTSALIEKFFVYNGFDLPHDTYKEILYNNKKCMSNTEDKIKRYYDGYMFLLHNSSNILSSKILLIFFYIIYQKEIDINTINKIINKHVFNESLPSLEKAINLLLIISDELSFTDKIDKLLIPIMFFNYELVKNNIPSIRLVRNDIIKYEKLIDNIDYKASALQGGISAIVNGASGYALRIYGVVSGTTKVSKFINAAKISSLGVAMTGYLTYYSFPSANKIRNKTRKKVFNV